MPAARTRIPDVPPTTLIRDRLHTLLDAAVFDGDAIPPVTVVCAPAGAGKTTMLAAWARRRIERWDTPVAWVSVDTEDNDPTVLWTVILQALRERCALPLGDLPIPRGESYAVLVNAIVAEFERVSEPVVLIIDGVHEIQSNAAVRTMNLLLRDLPRALRVVLATRFLPPLVLPRLRLENRLREIGPEELTFTAAEARLLYAKEGITLTRAGLAALMERTEGWAAGLRFASLSADSALPRITGDDRVVADYLLREVFARQPDEVQQFMLATCVCRAFTTDLAVELSGRENAGQIIDRLERTSILTSTADEAPAQFRYHPLLRGYLCAELGRRRFSALQRQHRIAAVWLNANGDPLRALEHSLKAGDHELAARLAARSGLGHILKGQSALLWRILRTAPEHVLNRPSVALVAAAAALDLGDVPAADRWLRRIADSVYPPRTQRLKALRATVQLHRSRLAGDIRPALTELRATNAGRTGDFDLDLMATFNAGVAQAWLGRQQAAEAALRQALSMAGSEQRDAIALECRTHLVAIAAVHGDLSAVDRQIADTLAFARTRGWAESSRAAYAYTLFGVAAYQRLEDDKARRLATVAAGLMPAVTDATIELCVHTLDAMIEFDTSHDPHEIVADLRGHWKRLAKRDISPAMIAYAAPARQRMALRVGEYPWALEVLDEIEKIGIRCGEQDLLRAVHYVHKGKMGSPRRILAPLLSGQTRAVAASTVVEAWLLEAHLADRIGERQRAHEALCRALAIAAPHNARRPFRDAGHSVRALLARGAGRFGRLEVFATSVRDALPAHVPDLADGLTAREQVLLAELPSMRTTEEIAQNLFVSVNTVKTHLRGIYRKLGVRHRRDAISVARERGLL
ncbi:LuxR C-terminal-related transcriptional regulator [Kibdelosporangium philippinense]|uniref:LuxR C-terminal-related transcriptional regulator n=1 Tax=Kibdelosporangium philippinense TaxID=211113 RepID=A0ABS8Z9A7_9PSEU|nr:LuxR C-terminal-related transcriptional regulator [Kibdelosporangium philippinense]MCE7004400.1 LuxR C-terminal-related transcriptional regulator [Kibdelosporangium philippinense]